MQANWRMSYSSGRMFGCPRNNCDGDPEEFSKDYHRKRASDNSKFHSWQDMCAKEILNLLGDIKILSSRGTE